MAEKKTKKPKFHIPAAADRCVKEIIPKEKFHQASFRYTQEKTKKSPSGKTNLMVGCPKYVKGRGMKKAYRTTWTTAPAAIKSRSQCRWVEGPKRGEKAGMRAHIVIEPTGKSGRCRAGYVKATRKSKGKR